MSVMKASEAMRFIAAAYHTPWSKRSDDEKYMTEEGVCFAVDSLRDKLCMWDTYYELKSRIEFDGRKLEYRVDDYFILCRLSADFDDQPFPSENDDIRGDYCNLLAEQFEEEGL